MPAVTVTTLIERAKAAADMRDNFVTPTQWLRWATQERYALDLFIARSGWPLQTTTTDITVTGEEDGGYGLSPDIMVIVCVHQVDGTRYRLLRHQNFADFIPNSQGTGSSVEYRVHWAADNLSLGLYPRPRVGDVYRVTYIAHPFSLVLESPGPDEAATVQYPMGWEERIVLGMARRALVKEESDTRAIDQEIALCDARIESACWNRVLSEAPSVRNVDHRTYGWSDRYSLPPFGEWAFI